eukprot:CAMPEP_0171314298 /NCGR_PEP_ID=MMETSP0816-20121228/50208_1 /TAXON_ID=420281 /ORGANISM="Proboscia inermis, Strain CCAP1064/1" /LENGTH=113 /DNA_ID=CAMNT_0011803019 /DNA_START=66 /DNA_END=407 /DNA_ORIENTATION=+
MVIQTLARRLSLRNEPHFQENYSDDEVSNNKLTMELCQRIAAKVEYETNLPEECKEFGIVVLKRRKSKSDNAIAFEGMSGASSSMASRERGMISHAKIQRRMTKTRSEVKRSW